MRDIWCSESSSADSLSDALVESPELKASDKWDASRSYKPCCISVDVVATVRSAGQPTCLQGQSVDVDGGREDLDEVRE